MTIFEKIINKEIPSYKIWEDERHIAILDINPIVDGQIVVIPKIPHEYLFDMSDDEYGELMIAAKDVANLVKSKLECKRVCMIVEGYEVPHVHIKLYPTNSPRDIRSRSHEEEQDLIEKNKLNLETVYAKLMS